MANTQIRNLLTEINVLLQRPPQVAQGADQSAASEEWQYREQMKQLRSRLEGMTDDSQIDALEQKFRALIHQLQPLNPTNLPSVPPLPPLKARETGPVRPMPLPPLIPMGGSRATVRIDPESAPSQPLRQSPAPQPNNTAPESDPAPIHDNDIGDAIPQEVTPQREPNQGRSIDPVPNFTNPLPLPPGFAVGSTKTVVLAVGDTLDSQINNNDEFDSTEREEITDIASQLDQETVNTSRYIAKNKAQNIIIASQQANDVVASGSNAGLEPQLLALLEQVVQKTVQQAVQESLDHERTVMVNEISQTIAQNINQNINRNNEATAGVPENNPYYERLEEEIANLKLQKELLNQEITRLANAQESWSSQVATMQAQQQEGFQDSLQAAVQEAVQSAVQETLGQTLEQTIEQALQNQRSHLEASGDDEPSAEVPPIAPEILSQVQQQTDRFLSSLDAMFNNTFQNLEQDLEGYKAAFEQKLSYIEQLEYRGEALLSSITAQVDQGENREATDAPSPTNNLQNLASDTAVINSQTRAEPSVNPVNIANLDLPVEIDRSYLSPVQEYVDESLIERLLAIDNETEEDITGELSTEAISQTISEQIFDDKLITQDADSVASQDIDSATGNMIRESQTIDIPLAAITDAAALANSGNVATQTPSLGISQEVNTIEDLLTLFPDDELFDKVDEIKKETLTTSINPLNHDFTNEEWQEIYPDDVTIAVNTINYAVEDFAGKEVPTLDQPEIDLERDVLSHLSELAQMLEEVEKTSAIIPNSDQHSNLDDWADTSSSLASHDLKPLIADAATPATPSTPNEEEDATLIALPMMGLMPLPPMPKGLSSKDSSHHGETSELNPVHSERPLPLDAREETPTKLQLNVDHPNGGQNGGTIPLNELKIPNLTEVTADDELLSWLNDHPLSGTNQLEPNLITSEEVTMIDDHSKTERSNLQPLPLPVLPSLPTITATVASDQITNPLTSLPALDQASMSSVQEIADSDNSSKQQSAHSQTSEQNIEQSILDLEELANDDESLVLLPGQKMSERQEVMPWDDSLIRELAEDLNNLGEGGGANPLVATNIDQVIRNTPFRHTQPISTSKNEATPEQPLPPKRNANSGSSGGIDDMPVFPMTNKDDPDQLFAAVIAEQIAMRSLAHEPTEAMDELDALFLGQSMAESAPLVVPVLQNQTISEHDDDIISPFDDDTNQIFQSLEEDVADLFADSVNNAPESMNADDHAIVFHDLTSDLDDLSQELSGNSRTANNIEKLLELANIDDEITYIISDDTPTVLEPKVLEPKPEHGISSIDDFELGEMLNALDEITSIHDDTDNSATSLINDYTELNLSNLGAISPSKDENENSWQDELDRLANFSSMASLSDYVKPPVSEEEPLSSADFFASLEKEAAEEEESAKLNAFANRVEHLSTPTLRKNQQEVALPEIIDPIEQRLTALADATERGEAEDKLWQSLFDEIERPNFNEPLLDMEREKLGLSAAATDRQGAVDIVAETVESLSQSLVPPPPEQEIYGLNDQWILGIDIGAYHLRASLCNGSSGKFYPLSFKLDADGANLAEQLSFMASYSGELTLQDPLNEDIPIAKSIIELPNNGYPLINWKSLFNLGLPYKSITSWQPVLQWSDQHQVTLRWLIAATVASLKQLPQMVYHPRLPEVAEILTRLQGVVVAQPSADADTFALNIRETVLAAGLVTHPEQVMVVDQSIAPLLRQVQVHQRQGQTNATEGISLFLDAGATGTSVGLLKGIPLAPTKHDLCHRHWDYGGNSLDQDVALQLLYPHWRMVSNPDRNQCDLSDLSLPSTGSIAIQERAILGQRLRSSAVGLALLQHAKNLKETLTNHPDQERWQAEVHGLPLMVLRRELESLVFQPYIQQINRELNTLLSLSGIFGADITKVYLIGGAWQFPLILRWLQQKLPNAQMETLSPTTIAEGLAVAPLHPHLLNLARQQYSDYFLLREICHLQLSDAVNPNSLLQQLQLQGINIKACRDRILTILQGDFPRGLFPWQEPEGCLVQNDPSLQSELFSGNLFELNSDGTYQPNVAKFQQLRTYLEVILCNMRQTLTEPMVFPPLTNPAAIS